MGPNPSSRPRLFSTSQLIGSPRLEVVRLIVKLPPNRLKMAMDGTAEAPDSFETGLESPAFNASKI